MSFTFRQFHIEQDKCAMKVGTDGVLLGSWAKGGKRILDIGTGTGLIALMMAQRFPDANIDAIELDENAVIQATENVLRSPFAKQIVVKIIPKKEKVFLIVSKAFSILVPKKTTRSQLGEKPLPSCAVAETDFLLPNTHSASDSFCRPNFHAKDFRVTLKKSCCKILIVTRLKPHLIIIQKTLPKHALNVFKFL